MGGGRCPNPDDGTTLCSRRVIIIPIIDAFGNGKKDATILGFALFFLESYNGGEVTGRFVKADVNMGALTGTYDPNSLVHSVKLTGEIPGDPVERLDAPADALGPALPRTRYGGISPDLHLFGERGRAARRCCLFGTGGGGVPRCGVGVAGQAA